MKLQPISLHLLSPYMMGIWSYYMDHPEEELPSDLSVFDEDAANVRAKAIANREFDDLRLVLDTVLAHDDDWLDEHFGMELSEILRVEPVQTDTVLHAILRRYREKMWPGAGPIPPEGPPGVELVDIGVEEWRRQRAASRS
ncbi:hypothetical protein [Haliangium sp.]|uniref:hypothetical protein n=1 Tax=Haliangium sp. TaxID=2663208 RepID=UPI003D0B4BA2